MNATPPSAPLHVHRTRPVDPQWHCQKSGECCTKPAEVVMTRQEAQAIANALLLKGYTNIELKMREVDEQFMALKAGPCPLFAFNTCLVYESRPYNCRRFGCMRPDPKSEPLELNGDDECANLVDRLMTSRVARRAYNLNERKAQRWADKHGWKREHDEKV